LACGLAAAPLLPSGATATTRSLLAWDIGVSVFLVLALVLFLTEDHRHMAADAAAQEEGEWTIFAMTVSAVAISMVAIADEFGAAAQLKGASKGLHGGDPAADLADVACGVRVALRARILLDIWRWPCSGWRAELSG
jgi:uncharacterized membrane protein